MTQDANDSQVGGTHYKDLPIQPWDVMEAWLTPEEFRGFLKGNMLKYLARGKRKQNGNEYEDLLKANHYNKKLIEQMEKNK